VARNRQEPFHWAEAQLRREGETYGMRLDSPAGAATDEASGAQTAGISGKVTILIVAAAAAGVTAWGFTQQ
jgi:hypothetical protein